MGLTCPRSYNTLHTAMNYTRYTPSEKAKILFKLTCFVFMTLVLLGSVPGSCEGTNHFDFSEATAKDVSPAPDFISTAIAPEVENDVVTLVPEESLLAAAKSNTAAKSKTAAKRKFIKAKAGAKAALKKLARHKKHYLHVLNKAPANPTSVKSFKNYKKWIRKVRRVTRKFADLTVRVTKDKKKGLKIWQTFADLEKAQQHEKTRLQADQAAREDVNEATKQAQQENDKFYGKRKKKGKKEEDLHFFDTKEEMIQMRDELHGLMRKHKILHKKLSAEEHNHMISKFVYHIGMGHHKTMNDQELAEAIAGTRLHAGRRSAAGGMSYGETATVKCVQAAIGSVAPKFCWKGSSYNHDTNMRCPSGWWHPPGMAECFQPCRSGYKWAWGGTCWTTCPAHHVEVGPLCKRAWWGNCCAHVWAPWGRRRARICSGCPKVSVVGRSHYWPSRFTFLDGRMECRQRYEKTYSNGDTDLQYQAGALCYRRCDSFVPGPALTGCGFDACAGTGAQCAQAIGNMIFEIAMAVAGIIAIVASAGAAGPAVVATRVAMTSVSRKMGKRAAKRLARNTAKSLRRGGTATFQKVAWRTAVKRGLKQELKNQVKSTPQTVINNWSQNAIKSYCQAQALRIYNAANPNSQKTMDPAAWDPTGFVAMTDKCKAGPEDMDCKAAIVGAAGNFDPTGLMGVAAAFMHKNCESCDLACRRNAETRVVDYTKHNNLFCNTYGSIDGGAYKYTTLAAAQKACDARTDCGGVKQWTCGAAEYGLCGAAGMQLWNYGAGRCTYKK